MTDQELLSEARAVSEQSYSPYSDLRVGAAAVGGSGTLYTGANVENASYTSTLCAEAVAIGRAVSAGERKIQTVAVISPDLLSIFPCGQCRQIMAEFDVERVVIESPEGGPSSHTLEELLPGAFTDWH